ncbi:MAG: glycosyl transferase, partial [Spirochaetaceae bacterium]
MQFGFFDDKNREYVIQKPDTPLPWINYLGSVNFFSIISHTAGGYSFYKDALLRRLTRFRYNTQPADINGRLFYIRDEDTIWSPAWKPVKTGLDRWECRHGTGYTKITSAKNDIEASLLFFIPVGDNAEITLLRVKNTGNKNKKIKLWSVIEFCLWNALDDMNNLQRTLSTGEVEIAPAAIFHTTEYRERRNHYSFYATNTNPSGFDTDRDAFFGQYNGYHEPEAVSRGNCCASVAHGWSPIAAFQFDIALAPGEEKEIIFSLGYVENKADKKWEKPGIADKKQAQKIIDKYSSPGQVSAALDELKSYWDGLLGVYSVSSPEKKLDRMVNIWNQYQCIVTFNISRSASGFETGIGRGIGFRDTNQDVLGCMHQIPQRVRERLLDVAATQLASGGAFHQYQPLTKRGNNVIGGDFNDDPLWLIMAVCAYIKETGDWEILSEKVMFENNPGITGTILEHLLKGFDFVTSRRGPHGLPLIGRADWNDCLNLNCFSETPDESFQTCTNMDGTTAESVFIAALMVLAGKQLAQVLSHEGHGKKSDEVNKITGDMEQTIVKHGWDGKWFLRAYDALGNKVGSSSNTDGKIFIETQGFCGIIQAGHDKGYPLMALESTEKYLATEHGIVLVDPAFTDYHLNLGEISSYPPGYKENGGIFCHHKPWV